MIVDIKVIAIVGVVAFLVYGAFTYPLYRLGRKFLVGSYWEYWLPVYNFVLLCRCAGLPSWYVVWVLLPPTGPGFYLYLWGSIARRLGHNFWIFGLGSFFGLPILVLAFDASFPHLDSALESNLAAHQRWDANQRRHSSERSLGKLGVKVGAKPARLYCVSGEFAGQELEVQEAGIIIGRDPEQANLVLASPVVSAAHVRLCPGKANRGLLVEDLTSTNGTYFLALSESGERPNWVELRGSRLLKSGDRFRLGEDAAVFEIT